MYASPLSGFMINNTQVTGPQGAATHILTVILITSLSFSGVLMLLAGYIDLGADSLGQLLSCGIGCGLLATTFGKLIKTKY